MAQRASTLPIHDAAVAARLLTTLPPFLRERMDGVRARRILADRLEHRQRDFLWLTRHEIYGRPNGIYRRLLDYAGCEFGDLERVVRIEGVEEALRALYRSGVYLTVDELKGRRAVVRGSVRLRVGPGELLHQGVGTSVPSSSGGSRGPGMVIPFRLEHIRDRSVDLRLFFEARGGGRWRNALWEVPGGHAIMHLLDYASIGAPAVRWFSQVAPGTAGLHPRYLWIGRVMWLAGVLARVPQPLPLHAPLDDPLPVVSWMAAVLNAGQAPNVHTNPSCAVLLAQTAREWGHDLRGAWLTISGEPITAARRRVIGDSGAKPVPRYAIGEAGIVAEGCLAPEVADEQHVLDDLVALIQPGHDDARPGLPPRALLLSSLRRTAPLLLLNVCMGDQGELTRRRCHCPMERFGWTTHLHSIRSYEKLTAGGVTFPDADVIGVLEELLPSSFGGGPTDYQLVEEESRDGRPRLRLVAHPGLGPLDERAVSEAFLNAVGSGSEGERLMGLQWRQGDIVRVERRVPYRTGTSKILHLHSESEANR